MKKISLIILGIFLISFISAIPICVDIDTPSSPEITVTRGVGNLLLTWTESIDIPDCSGIAYYEIWKNNTYLTQTSELTYTDIDVTYGTYSYIIYAVDKVGHTNSSNEAIITLTETTSTVVYTDNGGGGSGSSSRDKDEPQTFTPLTTDTSQDNGETDGIILEEPSETNFFSRMTGAVIGGVTNFAKAEPGSMILIVVIVWLTFFIAVRTYRLKKKSKSTSSSTPEPISQTETTEPETQ